MSSYTEDYQQFSVKSLDYIGCLQPSGQLLGLHDTHTHPGMVRHLAGKYNLVLLKSPCKTYLENRS